METNEFWTTVKPSKTELTTNPGVFTHTGTVGVGTTADAVLVGLTGAPEAVAVVTWAVEVPARYWRQAMLTNATDENVGFIIDEVIAFFLFRNEWRRTSELSKTVKERAELSWL